MVDIYEMMKDIGRQGQVGYEQGRQRREDMRSDSARKLFGVAAQGDQSALKQLYGVDPSLALKVKESNQGDRVKGAQFMHRAATVLKSTPDDQKPMVYTRLMQEAKANPYVAEFTQGLPDQYDPSIMKNVDGLIGMAGMYEDQPSSQNGIQSTFINDRGERVGILRNGQTQVLGMNAPNNQIVEGDGGYFGVNKTTLGAAPVQLGGAPAPMAPPRAPAGAGIATDAGMGVQPTAQDVQSNPGVTWDNGEFNSLSPIEKAKFNSYVSRKVPFQIVGGKVVAGQSSGTQLRPPPKAAGNFQVLSAQEIESLGLPKGTVAQRSADGRVDVISKPDAPDQMTELQRYKQDQANAEKSKRMGAATASIDETLSRIDELEKHPGFTDLGTAYGDLATGVPLIRTDAKGAQAKLEAVKGQIALATMAELKTLSSSGATGFGALNEKELALLQGSIDNLTTSVSFDDLKANLANVKKRLQAMKAGIGKESTTPSAPSAPAKPATGKKDYSGLF